MAEASFFFEGEPIGFRPGQSLAAALTAAGQRRFRRTAKGLSRGLFCGIGVCQDCLITVDGRPGLRACMTQAEAGQEVRIQPAFPHADPGSAAGDERPGLHLDPDVLVVGGGAAGLSAAIEARRAGAGVVVTDERKVPGGQYYKQPASGPLLDRQQRDGADLIQAAKECGVDILAGAEIWGAFDGLLFAGTQAGRSMVVRPRGAVIATGAYERPLMVPGWTLPGVMTTGAAQTLWRSYRTLPGRRIAFFGSGPLNLQVALELAQGGADVVLVGEQAASPLRQPLSALALLASAPGQGSIGVSMLGKLSARRIKLAYEAKLVCVEATETALHASFRQAEGEIQSIEIDVLCINAGFEPQNDILRLLGARMEYDRALGHFRIQRSPQMETTVPGLFAAGDCSGLGGARAACAEGRIAGRAAAAHAGLGDALDDFADRRELRRQSRFQSRLWKLHDIAHRPASSLSPQTIICRCEEVSAGEIFAAHSGGPLHAGVLKRATRAGMGRCQGRYCAPVLARLIAETTGQSIEERSYFAPRVPIKPVTVAAMADAQAGLAVAPTDAETGCSEGAQP